MTLRNGDGRRSGARCGAARCGLPSGAPHATSSAASDGPTQTRPSKTPGRATRRTSPAPAVASSHNPHTPRDAAGRGCELSFSPGFVSRLRLFPSRDGRPADRKAKRRLTLRRRAAERRRGKNVCAPAKRHLPPRAAEGVGLPSRLSKGDRSARGCRIKRCGQWMRRVDATRDPTDGRKLENRESDTQRVCSKSGDFGYKLGTTEIGKTRI